MNNLLLTASTLLFAIIFSGASAQELKLWDNKPAKDWMTDAYPIGNGRMGGMVFGGVAQERIQFNELSLWTGDESETGAYQAFGDLYIKFAVKDSTATDYQRELDISRSVMNIAYGLGGVNYKREYFCSFPDKVMALNYTASKPGAYSAMIQLTDAHKATITGNGASLQVRGKLDNGMAYSATAKIILDGGTVSLDEDGKQLNIQKANGFTILLSAATDYSNKRENKWKGEDPTVKIKNSIASASAKTYAQLLARHVADYQVLFGRVSLTLGSKFSTLMLVPTYQRIMNYKKNADPKLEALLFQYGRYLLISSSRKGAYLQTCKGFGTTVRPRLGGAIIIPTSIYK